MSIKKPELHIFADSSSKAYGCAAYFRIVENNKAKVSFVIGKSRLTPFKEKRLSIPKLELQAAVTATRIKTKLLEETNFDVKRIYFWSDSKTVLKYIYNEKKHFPVYVMHKLDEVRSNSNITDWNYIPTHHNVSDACACDLLTLLNLKIEMTIYMARDFYKQTKLMNISGQEKYTTI